MNEARRKEIAEAISKVEEAKSIIETAASEEREQFDEMTEKAQESDKGQLVEAAATNLEEALDACDDLIEKLNDAKV